VAANFFKVKNGLTLPNYSDLATLQDISSPQAGDVASVGGKVYAYDGTSWSILGALSVPVNSVSAAYTTTAQDYLVVCGGASTYTVTLASSAAGRVLMVKNAQSNNITVSPASGNIDGEASVTVEPLQSIQVVFDGTNWQLV